MTKRSVSFKFRCPWILKVRDHSRYFSHFVKPLTTEILTTENTEYITTPKNCKITVATGQHLSGKELCPGHLLVTMTKFPASPSPKILSCFFWLYFQRITSTNCSACLHSSRSRHNRQPCGDVTATSSSQPKSRSQAHVRAGVPDSRAEKSPPLLGNIHRHPIHAVNEHLAFTPTCCASNQAPPFLCKYRIIITSFTILNRQRHICYRRISNSVSQRRFEERGFQTS